MSVDMDSHSSKDGSPPPSQHPPLTPPSIHSFPRPLSPSPTMGYPPMPHFGKFNNSSSPLTSPPDSRSPHSSPPSLIPSSMMMQRPPPPGFISQSPLLLPRFPPMDISRSPGDYGDMRHFINRYKYLPVRIYSLSRPISQGLLSEQNNNLSKNIHEERLFLMNLIFNIY